jgi:hypothetical protein
MEPKRKRQKKHSKQIEYEKRIDFVTKFSDELILHVFYYLSERDLIQCTTVNSRWSRLANDEMVSFAMLLIALETNFLFFFLKKKLSYGSPSFSNVFETLFSLMNIEHN